MDECVSTDGAHATACGFLRRRVSVWLARSLVSMPAPRMTVRSQALVRRSVGACGAVEECGDGVVFRLLEGLYLVQNDK